MPWPWCSDRLGGWWRPRSGRVRPPDPASSRGRSDEDGVARASWAFHQHVLEVADNTVLTAVTRPLGYRIRRLFRLASDSDAETMCREHREFFDALAARDGARAAECALRHVVANREATLALFQARGWGAETALGPRHRRQLTPRLPAARSCLTGRWMNPRRRTMATWEGLER